MENTTNLSSAFKQVYHEGSDVYVKQQNLNAKFFKSLPVAEDKLSVEGTFNSVTMRGDETGGAMTETGGIAATDYRVTQKPKIMPKLMTYAVEVTGTLIRLTQDNKQAFAKESASVVEDRMIRAFRDLERQAVGIGTGQITLANGAGSGSTALIVDDAIQFRAGMYIDVWTALGGTQEVSNVKISNVNLSTNTLTLATASTWSDNSIVSKAGSITAAVTSLATALDMTGIQGIIDTTTYSTTFENVSVSTYNEWQGQVIDNAGAPISQDILSKLFDRISTNSGKNPTRLVSNRDQFRVFKNSELQKVHYVAQEIKSGTPTAGDVNEVKTKAYWGDLEWQTFNTLPQATTFMLNDDSIKRYQVGELALADLDGKTMVRKQGYDVIGGYFVYQGNIGTWQRNCNGKVINGYNPGL